MEQALSQAKDGRVHILGEMNKALSESRADVGQHTPKMEQVTVDKKISQLLLEKVVQQSERLLKNQVQKLM